ncbi:SLATT domain-containing protein [Aeromonas allosaccharophila]|nr:SLATT domain-containing protein [Aeromonas allosaccharophila]
MRDNIWFTYKARIQAHKRLVWLDFHSQLLLMWYAILSATLGVLTIRQSTLLGPNTDIFATILSIALLGVSLTVTNRDFRVRAMIMRTNYLQLQRLYLEIPANTTPTKDQASKYYELLAESENHHEIDDQNARVFAQGLTSRHPTCLEKFHAYRWHILRILITATFYILPVIIGIYTWRLV